MNFFTKQYIILASAVTIIITLIFHLALPQYFTISYYFLPTFFAFISYGLIKVLMQPKFEKIAKFSNAFMLTNFVKLFLYLIFLVVIILNIDQSKRVAFAVTFLSMYVIYAIVDTITLLIIFGNRKSQDDENEAVG